MRFLLYLRIPVFHHADRVQEFLVTNSPVAFRCALSTKPVPHDALPDLRVHPRAPGIRLPSRPYLIAFHCPLGVPGTPYLIAFDNPLWSRPFSH